VCPNSKSETIRDVQHVKFLLQLWGTGGDFETHKFHFWSDKTILDKNEPLEYYIQVCLTKSAVGGSYLHMMTGARLIVLSRRLLASVFTTLDTSSYRSGFGAGMRRWCSIQFIGMRPTNKWLGFVVWLILIIWGWLASPIFFFFMRWVILIGKLELQRLPQNRRFYWNMEGPFVQLYSWEGEDSGRNIWD
jgi:hypothetical protein